MRTSMRPRVAPPDPRRVEIGRRNQTRWKGHTADGLERLRQAAMRNKPWLFSTGPRTPEGKARCAANGRKLCRDVLSIPEVRAEIAQANAMIAELIELRQRAIHRDDSDAGGP